MSERKERCETCKFWDTENSLLDEGSVYRDGECRRHAPHPSQNGQLSQDGTADHRHRIDYWPCTNDYHWCGEWKPKEESELPISEQYLIWKERQKEGTVPLPVVKESTITQEQIRELLKGVKIGIGDVMMLPVNPQPTPNESTPIWELVIADMQARDKIGRERYGTPLQANNGRDALQDAYDECLDQCVYLKQAIVERDQNRADCPQTTGRQDSSTQTDRQNPEQI